MRPLIAEIMRVCKQEDDRKELNKQIWEAGYDCGWADGVDTAERKAGVEPWTFEKWIESQKEE